MHDRRNWFFQATFSLKPNCAARLAHRKSERRVNVVQGQTRSQAVHGHSQCMDIRYTIHRAILSTALTMAIKVRPIQTYTQLNTTIFLLKFHLRN